MSHDDAELSGDVESAFDPARFVELRITVRLPGECMPDGLPVIFSQQTMLAPEQVSLRDDPSAIVSAELERMMRLLVGSLCMRW